MNNLLICITLCFTLLACQKQNTDPSEVASFIERLKDDKQDRLKIPVLKSNNISELLDHSEDNRLISNFPRNPLSSFYMEKVSLGIYVLWTIESIRKDKSKDPEFYLFASLNPRIVRSSTGELVDQDAILTVVRKAYTNWWSSSLAIEDKLVVDPLQDLDLRWN